MNQRSSVAAKEACWASFSVIISVEMLLSDNRKSMLRILLNILRNMPVKYKNHIQIWKQKLTNCTRYVNFKSAKTLQDIENYVTNFYVEYKVTATKNLKIRGYRCQTADDLSAHFVIRKFCCI